mgnify:FL=1|jgi:hypothetical protein|tara:strand:- start:1095 stop:2075 length:981 start_codon:yes stop_codon:yes gene_type:complete
MAGLTIPKSNILVIQPKDVNGRDAGDAVKYTWNQVKEMFSDTVSNYNLESHDGRRAFRRSVREKLNRRHSPEYQRAMGNAAKKEAFKRDPEKVRESWRKQKKGGEQKAKYRAKLHGALTDKFYQPAFRAEIDELYRGAKMFPGKFQVDHIKRLVDGGLHDPDNLQALSKEAHRLKTALENSGKFEQAARVGAFNEYNLEPALRDLLAENVIEKKGLMNFIGDTYQKVKPGLRFAGKTALRAAPLAGTALSAKAASDYRKAGQDRLAAMAALSAVPGPLGWAGLAGEMGGLLYNKVTEDPNFLGRGILSDGSQTTPFPVIRQRRGHF